MSVAYERGQEPRSGWDAWGTLVYGTARVPIRLLVVVLGTLVWLLAMLLVGGGEAITAIWTNALFLVPLVLVGSLVRTVRLRWIAIMVFAGGALMGLMYLLAQLVAGLFEDGATRAVLVPLLEEGLKVLPVLAFLWIGRRTYSWTLGATDVLILAAASGVGFGVVEDAYIRAHAGWPAQIDWLPVTELIGGRLIVGHAIWAALAGATIGLALLLRTRRPIVLPVALGASGFLVSFIDHAANNYSNTRSDALGDLMNIVSQNGWTPLWLFFLASLGCLVADALIVYRRLPGQRRYPTPPRAPGSRGLREAWGYVTDRRALAFARFRWQQARPRIIEEAARASAQLEWSLFMRQPQLLRAELGAALAASVSAARAERAVEEPRTAVPPTPEPPG